MRSVKSVRQFVRRFKECVKLALQTHKHTLLQGGAVGSFIYGVGQIEEFAAWIALGLIVFTLSVINERAG